MTKIYTTGIASSTKGIPIFQGFKCKDCGAGNEIEGNCNCQKK
jgi:hypothetical protein